MTTQELIYLSLFAFAVISWITPKVLTYRAKIQLAKYEYASHLLEKKQLNENDLLFIKKLLNDTADVVLKDISKDKTDNGNESHVDKTADKQPDKNNDTDNYF